MTDKKSLLDYISPFVIISFILMFIGCSTIYFYEIQTPEIKSYCVMETPCHPNDRIIAGSEKEEAFFICKTLYPLCDSVIVFEQRCKSGSKEYDYVCGCFPISRYIIGKDFKVFDSNNKTFIHPCDCNNTFIDDGAEK